MEYFHIKYTITINGVEGNMLYSLILAGGKGTRLYPLSRSSNPKQFLSIHNNGKSFLSNTVDRIRPIIHKDNIYVVTNQEYEDKIRDELKDIREENIITEPANKEPAKYNYIGLVNFYKIFFKSFLNNVLLKQYLYLLIIDIINLTYVKYT